MRGLSRFVGVACAAFARGSAQQRGLSVLAQTQARAAQINIVVIALHPGVQRAQRLLVFALVGVDIENLDIADLDQRLAQTDNGDLQQVYANLRSGSTNHLRAFTGSGGGQPAARTHAAGRGGRP